MKIRKWLVIVSEFLVVGLLASLFLWSDGRVGPKNSLFENAQGEGAENPGDAFLFERTSANNVPSTARLSAIRDQARAVRRETARTDPALARMQWRFRGPRQNIGARVSDMTVDPEIKDLVWVASSGGGVWKSTDAGMTYKRAWPNNFPQSMGALVQTPNGTLYAGTGEANPGGGSLTYGGNGIYKSTDRAKTWKNVGLRTCPIVGRMAIDPKNSKHILVACTGNLFHPGGTRGLYETRDAGQTWKRILAPPNDTTGAIDVAFKPDDPKTILVSMWDHIRHPDVRFYTGVGSGIWRSTDGGKTFTRLGPANGLPPPNDETGRIGVGFAESNPNRVYAIYANNRVGAYQAFFTSVTAGAQWVVPPGAATLGGSQSVYGWWFGRVYVDPKDPNHVLLTGLLLSESTDGAASFIPEAEIHVDHHVVVWDPHRPGRAFVGNDGGIYRSDENGAVGTWTHAKSMPFNQFFTLDVSVQDPNRINGGMQDNGSGRTWTGTKAGSTEVDAWNIYNGGDGVENVINPKDKQNVFACSQYGSCRRSDDGGDDMNGMDNQFERNGWVTPIEFQPGSDKIMYWAGNKVARSDDRGRNWTVISPDLGKGEVGREVNPLYAGHWGTVQAIGLNKAKPKIIYAGTDNGYLWKTVDGGDNWVELTPDKALPKSWVTQIDVKKNDPDVVYLTYGGYHGGDLAPYVFKSIDGGKSWKDISANLPRAPVQDIILTKDGRLFLANDVGVHTTRVNDIRWRSVGRGLPFIVVNDIRYVPRVKTLYAATFGRGIYSVNLSGLS